jgi:hypothetical protein
MVSFLPFRFVRFNGFRWTQESFPEIAESLKTSTLTIVEHVFSNCKFDEISGNLFCSLFSAAGVGTTKLAFFGKVEFAAAHCHQTLLDVITSPVLCEFSSCNLLDSVPDREDWHTFLEGLMRVSCQIRKVEIN